MPSATSSAAKKFFLNKRFYLHVRGRVNTHKAAELIKIFGGQIDEFLESTVSYVLTDIPKREWPPVGTDDILKRARTQNVKLMSLHDLTLWCSKYLSSQSSSDEDDDSKVQVVELREPYIKFEDINGYYAPTAKEIPNWPIFNQSCPNGRALFQDCWPITLGGGYLTKPSPSTTQTPNHSVQLTPQMTNSKNIAVTPTVSSSNMTANINQSLATPLAHSNIVNGQVAISQVLTSLDPSSKPNQAAKNLSTQQPTTPITTNNNLQLNNNAQARGVKRRHLVYCEVCNLKLSGKLEDHIQSAPHKTNMSRLNWTEIQSVIQSIPSFSSLSKMRKGPNESIRLSDQHEFLCLHKVESVSQLFTVCHKSGHEMIYSGPIVCPE